MLSVIHPHFLFAFYVLVQVTRLVLPITMPNQPDLGQDRKKPKDLFYI